jgi:dehydrogenase/reductase SDR family protein 12
MDPTVSEHHVHYYLNTLLEDVIDTALDRSIALGYGRLGFLVRERMPGWPAEPPRIDGHTVLITGAASGLGLASACGFARLGATVHALARGEGRAAAAVAEIARAVPGADVRPQVCDLASLAAVASFGERFAAAEPRLDVLVNNAGTMPAERTHSADGHELMFATHVLAPIALTSLLAGPLTRGAPSRVINVSSGGMYAQSLPVGDWESERTEYSPRKLYARTKREEVVITELMAARLYERGVAVHAMHPGWSDTEGIRRSMPGFRSLTRPILRSAEDGADTIVWLGAAREPLAHTGLFWHDRRPRPTHYHLGASPDSQADREALWRHCGQALDAAGIAGL